MASDAISQRLYVVLLHELWSQLGLVRRIFVVDIEDFRLRPDELRRIAVAVQTPVHVESIDLEHEWHLVDGAEQRLSEEPLTRREQEVLALLAQGLTNREIAQALVISEVTAKVHVRHILKKLGVRTRTQAALKAVDNQPAAASRLLNGTTE